MIYILPALIVLFTLILRQILYHNRKIILTASIEKIKLSVIRPNLITPEVQLFFKYPYGGGVYTGNGYISIKDFQLSASSKIFYNDENIPILEDGDSVYGDEEHIEAYLLGQFNSVQIHIDPVEPYRFEIIQLTSESTNSKKI